jgi:hypothetical protein
MDTSLFQRLSEFEWRIEPFGKMRVPITPNYRARSSS